MKALIDNYNKSYKISEENKQDEIAKCKTFLLDISYFFVYFYKKKYRNSVSMSSESYKQHYSLYK